MGSYSCFNCINIGEFWFLLLSQLDECWRILCGCNTCLSLSQSIQATHSTKAVHLIIFCASSVCGDCRSCNNISQVYKELTKCSVSKKYILFNKRSGLFVALVSATDRYAEHQQYSDQYYHCCQHIIPTWQWPNTSFCHAVEALMLCG